ncbi:RNA polymerase sigma factor SigJ [Ornithinibacillus xuwenensis]|uniref:RNA polymerase sigma factor SigJ n=1 Tax=Ornithinibacillus xuwenensis TaxID=3144668 RepID=A0ABU9XHS3_9BACI
MEIKVMYQEYRPLLFTLAYQLMGTTVDAEDAVQDVFVKLHSVEVDRLEEPKSYLCKMVTNRCLDHLKSAKNKREQYVGPWLPEPICTSNEDVMDIIIKNDLLSYAILVLMEKLTLVERSIFVLKEALRFDYKTIASIVEKSEVNCRKIYSRAYEKLQIQKEDKTLDVPANSEWFQAFIHALEAGDIEQLLPLLSEDVTVFSDGGGKVPAAIYPIHSPMNVIRFLVGLMRKLPQFGEDVAVEFMTLNKQDAIVISTAKEILVAAIVEFRGNVIENIFFVRNPDKLQSIR